MTLLDALRMAGDPCIDADNPSLLIKNYIKKNRLDFGKLEQLAGRLYSQETLARLTLCRADA